MNIKLNFYGFNIDITSESEEIIDLMNKNFSYFVSEMDNQNNLSIEVKIVENPLNYLPKDLVSTKQTINSISYDVGNIRYNDYYGEVLSVFNYKNETAVIYGNDINRLHEITYLIILSRQGKWSDTNGLHKIHAMAVNKNDKNLIVMMPMKGGKSTLFTKFLKDKYNIISDDTPMINSKGEILNFPIRFGLEQKEYYKELLECIPEKFKFKLNREEFGTKVLVDTKFFRDLLSKPAEKSILVNGIRHSGEKCLIKKVSKLIMLKNLITHMIVGIGLPMVIEYFLETRVTDHFKNLRILYKRILASIKLMKKSECYTVYMTYNIDENYSEIKKLID